MFHVACDVTSKISSTLYNVAVMRSGDSLHGMIMLLLATISPRVIPVLHVTLL